MHWTETKRSWFTLAIAPVLLLAAACGGGDKGPTGPGPGDGLAGTYDLVALGLAGLPADAELEDCMLTRFYRGGLALNGDGTWQMALQVHDDSGDWEYDDEGEFEQDGTTVWLDSGYSETSYQATFDGAEMKIMYDWCSNGVPDVQLVFDR